MSLAIAMPPRLLSLQGHQIHTCPGILVWGLESAFLGRLEGPEDGWEITECVKEGVTERVRECVREGVRGACGGSVDRGRGRSVRETL